MGGNINDATQAFRYCSSLTRIDNFNVNNSLFAHYLFNGCNKLSNIEWKGVLSYGEVGNSLFAIDNCPLSVDTMVGLFNILAEVTTQQILTLGSTNLAKLTDEQKMIAVNKGWLLKGYNTVRIPASMDISSFTTNNDVTKVYVELTSENATSRIAEIYAKFPNITEIYLFEDGSITEAVDIFTGVDNTIKAQITKVVFMEGYFNNITLDKREYGILDEVPVAWGGYGFTKDVTSIYVVNIPSDNFELNISNAVLNRFGDGLINWGDGTIENETYGVHTYATAGIYTIKTKCQNGGNGYTPQISSKSYIIEVKQIATNLRNLYKAFDGLSNLTKVTAYNLTPINCQGMFAGCSSLTEIVGLDTWDMSNCTNTNNMFTGCNLLTSIELYNLAPTDCVNMFTNCSSLTEIVGMNTWDMSNCTSCASMFNNCSSLTEIVGLDTWDMSNCASCDNMFDGASSLNISRFPDNFFYNCTLQGAFENNKSIVNIDLSNQGKINGMRSAFRNCTKLEEVTLDNIDFTSMGDAEYAFDGCSSLKTINMKNCTFTTFSMYSLVDDGKVSNFYMNGSTGTITDIAIYTFWGASNLLTNINWGNMIITGNVQFNGGLPNATVETLVNTFNALYDYSVSGESHSIVVGATALAKLTDEQIAIATNKGWTIS